jgi:hypothetical protein
MEVEEEKNARQKTQKKILEEKDNYLIEKKGIFAFLSLFSE